MEARVQKISKEIITPSSQTLYHLKKFRFSYLDQLINPMYIPLIFFYQPNQSRFLTTSTHVQISQHLKQSLSQTLTTFYPLAGRVHDNFAVNCNDAGVEFITARIQANLMHVTQSDPTMEELKQYIPLDPTSVDGSAETRPLCLVQVTFFDCGGIAVGICFSHQVADFTSIMAFVDAWASTYRGEAKICRFSFDLETYFPAKDFPGSGFWKFCMSDENYVTKRFVFYERELEALKKQTGSISNDPTRVELVSAFIWKHFMGTFQENKVSAAFHAVNLRARNLSLENVFGNCLMSALAFSNATSLGDVAGELRRSIRRIDENYINDAKNGDNYLKDLYDMLSMVMKEGMEFCCFSSWCRFPVYDVDYGWGKPVWCCTTALPLKNLTVLLSSRCGKGIEAWVNMKKDNIELLENGIKLLYMN